MSQVARRTCRCLLSAAIAQTRTGEYQALAQNFDFVNASNGHIRPSRLLRFAHTKKQSSRVLCSRLILKTGGIVEIANRADLTSLTHPLISSYFRRRHWLNTQNSELFQLGETSVATPVSTFSRRSFLKGTAGALASPVVLRSSRALAAPNTVTMCVNGGSYQEALIKYALDPFTKETGINVRIVPTPDLAKIKAQQLTGNVEWDLFEQATPTIMSGSKQGFWEPLDPSMFDANDLVVPPTRDVVQHETYTEGIAWDPTKYGQGKHPTTFAEYWDLKKFPGRRLLRNYPWSTMEAALLADGVLPKDVYPLDVERVFKALDRIKPSIVSWVPTAPQMISILQTGEADFGCSTASRVKATNGPGGGTPLAFSFEQTTISTAAMAVLKGAPNKNNAMKLVAYVLRPEVQARLCENVGLGPASKKAIAMMSGESRKWLPDMNNPKHVIIDSAFWADHAESLSIRFKEWILS